MFVAYIVVLMMHGVTNDEYIRSCKRGTFFYGVMLMIVTFILMMRMEFVPNVLETVSVAELVV